MSIKQGGNTIAGTGYTKSEIDTIASGKANVALDNITSAGKEVCANLGMPSSRVDTLTAVVSGGQFTAPADGYFVARATASAAGKYLELTNGLVDSLVHSGYGGLDVSVFIPVQKGQVATTYYSTNTPTFKFVYAEGAQ